MDIASNSPYNSSDILCFHVCHFRHFMVCGMGCRVKNRSCLNPLLFAAFALIFVTNYILQHFEISSNFSRNYLDDLLALPIILYMAQVLMRWIYRRPQLNLDNLMLLYGFLMVSMAFEWLLPKYFNHLTADYWDILCYAFGTLMFYFMNRTKNQEPI